MSQETMTTEATLTSGSRRNRIIAITAGAITVVAIVLAFASEYLELPWKWIRPAAELLLLGELVGLVVLERHQLFEPVKEAVGNTSAEVIAMHAELRGLAQRLDLSGQISFYVNPSQTVRALERALREALAREQSAPQVVRWTRLADYPRPSSNPELGAELLELLRAVLDFGLVAGSPPDAKGRLWTSRNILTFTNLEGFDVWREHTLPLFIELGALNFETKLLIRARSRAEAILTPNLVTDRDAFVTLDDDRANNRWGFLFQGSQYVAVFARWFDELWASIPDTYLIQSRSGVNQKALERIRKELEAVESERVRQAT
jgi:hypothetical protein